MFLLGSIVTVSGFILASVISSMILFAHADNINPGVFSTDSKPYNLSYGEWTAKWWQWADSIPQDVNPAADETGKNCGQKQSGPVWFLAGTKGGSAERSCTIPTGKAILWGPINVECSYAEFPNLKTESELHTCAKSDQDKVTNVEATVDGIPLKDLKKYRVDSPLFNLTLPENNVLGLRPQTTQAVSDGYWVFLEPLPAGEHTIYSNGVLVGINDNFVSTITYHITVKP